MEFTDALIEWYDENRRTLPWRGAGDAYAVLVSEFMLQQTRASAVIPYYSRFMAELPTVEALAACPEENFTAPALEAHFAAFLEEKQIKPAQLIHALRVAVTGKGVGIGMFEALALLGKGRTHKRLAARDHKPGESA